MIMRLFIFGLISFSIVLTACKNSNTNPSQTKSMHDQIMIIHDEAMPKTSEINRLVKQLKEEKKYITPNNESLLKTFDAMVKELEDADEFMMEWMSKYKSPDFSDESENTKAYLESELRNITLVKDKIERAITRSTNFYNRMTTIRKNQAAKSNGN